MSRPTSPTQSTEVPEEAVHPAAKVIARALRHREEQIRKGRMGDRQTETPNQIAEEALADAAPAIRNQEGQRIQEALAEALANVPWVNGRYWKFMSPDEKAIHQRRVEEILAALDTLDPSGEESTVFERRQEEEEASRAAYRTELSRPSGEQGEEEKADDDWPDEVTLYRRHRSTKTLMVAGAARLPDLEYRRYVPATDPSKEESADGV